MQDKTNLFFIEYSKVTLESHKDMKWLYKIYPIEEERNQAFSRYPTKYFLHLSFATNEEAMALYDRMQNEWKLPVEIFGNRIKILPVASVLSPFGISQINCPSFLGRVMNRSYLFSQ